MRRALALLLVTLLLAGCTGSSPDPDQDGDLVDDEVEREGKIIEITTIAGVERRHVTSDPDKRDTDGDGLADGDELLVRGTDPRDPDTDDDGLLDGHDRSSPDEDTASAWRAAGILEVGDIFLGELDACPPGSPQLRSHVASSDLPFADDLLDGEELRGWEISVRGEARHVASDPCQPDTDKDGLLDHDEKLRLTDPRNPDTDADGTPDASDGDPLWDLALAFRDLEVALANETNGSRTRILFSFAGGAAELTSPGNATATLDVPDQAAQRRVEVSLIVTAEDLRTGERLALFEDPRGVILSFELLAGSVEGVEADGEILRFSGDDGSVSFAWSVARR